MSGYNIKFTPDGHRFKYSPRFTHDIVHEVQVDSNDFTQAPYVMVPSIPLRFDAIQNFQHPALSSGATAINTPMFIFGDFTNATTGCGQGSHDRPPPIQYLQLGLFHTQPRFSKDRIIVCTRVWTTHPPTMSVPEMSDGCIT